MVTIVICQGLPKVTFVVNAPTRLTGTPRLQLTPKSCPMGRPIEGP